LRREISQLHGIITLEHVRQSMPILLRRLKPSWGTATAVAVPPHTNGPAVSAPPGPDPAEKGAGPPAPPFLSLREAAEWLCVSLPTLKRTIAKGDLNTIRVGKRRKVPATYLAAYVAKDILLPERVIGANEDDRATRLGPDAGGMCGRPGH
jgi:excisionase family DNA binding protein